MRAKRLVLLVGLIGLFAIVAATTMAMARPTAQGAALAKKEAMLQFSVAIGDPDFDLLMIGDPDFDLLRAVDSAIRRGANIGSSGQDGFSVDSFFDIEYRIDLSTSTSTGSHTVDVEIHATPNGPGVNPVAVINNVKKELDKGVPTKRKEYTGHVTLLK